MTLKDLDNVISAAKQQLTRVLGSDQAQVILTKAYKMSGVKAVTNAAELLSFADALVAQGGFIEVVGRGLKVEALLRGARTSANQASSALERGRPVER
jgi:hypothetical protein